jgi:hypothetical protein
MSKTKKEPAGIVRVRDLEIDQDIAFQKSEWKVVAIGKMVIFIFLAASFLGLFGAGVFSKAHREDPQKLISVSYERFGRLEADLLFKVRLNSLLATEGNPTERRIWINDEYLENVQIQEISPEPVRVEAGSGGQAYIFATYDVNQPIHVFFYVKPMKPGYRKATFRIPGAAEVDIGQFIYP